MKKSHSSTDTSFLKLLNSLVEINPFSSKRRELESCLLGRKVELSPLNHTNRQETEALNLEILTRVREKLLVVSQQTEQLSTEQKYWYRNGVWFLAFYEYQSHLQAHWQACRDHPHKTPGLPSRVVEEFEALLAQFLVLNTTQSTRDNPLAMNPQDVAELLGFCFQLQRGVSTIVTELVGSSPAMSELRVNLWETIFTRRLLWSFQYLKDRMANFSTLILGPSGAGKELVARAVGWSQFVPFDRTQSCFVVNPASEYHSINLSALTATLIESELFGHQQGAFTGATETRPGLLELCSPYGVLFLDEIGELNPEHQVKLLRVLQTREFFSLGSRKPKVFLGRIVSATNRNLSELVEHGLLREDFLYRIGSTVVRVPSLSVRVGQSSTELDELTRLLLERVLGQPAPVLYQQILQEIKNLFAGGYAWPGNVRELEQCIRSLLVSSSYEPLLKQTTTINSNKQFWERIKTGSLSMDELITRYCALVYEQTRSYQRATAVLGIDWRTVRKYVQSPQPE